MGVGIIALMCGAEANASVEAQPPSMPECRENAKEARWKNLAFRLAERSPQVHEGVTII
jgi:hypothetical protein